nr:RNA-directed DNA polymerase, eukaryota [Tanacetum cinerariifolium]
DFSVKSAREVIDKHVLVVSPSQNRWSNVLPIRLNVFSWRMMLDRLPTMSNLHNRGINITRVLCPNCGVAIENRNHRFFGCSMSVDLARLIGRWWNIHIPIFDDPSSWDSWLNGMNLSSMQRRILEATIISMWWHIWKFRNLTLFSSKKPRKDMIFDDIVSLTYFWLSNRCRSFNGLGHNLFSVGQFSDGDLEAAFCSNTCYVRNLEGDDLLTGSPDSNLYTISISELASSSHTSTLVVMSYGVSELSFCAGSKLTFLAGPFQMGIFRETLAEGIEGVFDLGPERSRVYSDLSPEEKERYNADIRATKILLQGLPKDIYTLINHYTDAKDVWDNVKMLMLTTIPS